MHPEGQKCSSSVFAHGLQMRRLLGRDIQDPKDKNSERDLASAPANYRMVVCTGGKHLLEEPMCLHPTNSCTLKCQTKLWMYAE